MNKGDKMKTGPGRPKLAKHLRVKIQRIAIDYTTYLNILKASKSEKKSIKDTVRDRFLK